MSPMSPPTELPDEPEWFHDGGDISEAATALADDRDEVDDVAEATTTLPDELGDHIEVHAILDQLDGPPFHHRHRRQAPGPPSEIMSPTGTMCMSEPFTPDDIMVEKFKRQRLE